MASGSTRQTYTVEDGSGQVDVTVWGEGETVEPDVT